MYYVKQSKQTTLREEEDLTLKVKGIIDDVRKNGDEALVKYNTMFDKNTNTDFRVSKEGIEEAYTLVDKQLISDIKYAAQNIRKFAEKQRESMSAIDDYEIEHGLFLGHSLIPVDSCTCYVPGGSYPLFSTALMLVIPAKVAGVKRVVACSPVDKNTQKINPATLVAMDIAGADEIYAIGGVQAISAFSFGTQSIKRTNLIVGPGNKYVNEAKRQCYGNIGIDFIAGPSEVLVISDELGDPEIIAADLLAQLEHDTDARAILITTDEDLAKKVYKEVYRQLELLETKGIAAVSLENNCDIMVVSNLDEAYEYANEFAPEHLEVHTKDLQNLMEKLRNYGSLFINQNSAEVFGDYVAGPNHTLPTRKAAKYTGGVYVGTFIKTCSYQHITEKGIGKIAGVAYRMASNEGLDAHSKAAMIRLTKAGIDYV